MGDPNFKISYLLNLRMDLFYISCPTLIGMFSFILFIFFKVKSGAFFLIYKLDFYTILVILYIFFLFVN